MILDVDPSDLSVSITINALETSLVQIQSQTPLASSSFIDAGEYFWAHRLCAFVEKITVRAGLAISLPGP